MHSTARRGHFAASCKARRKLVINLVSSCYIISGKFNNKMCVQQINLIRQFIVTTITEIICLASTSNKILADVNHNKRNHNMFALKRLINFLERSDLILYIISDGKCGVPCLDFLKNGDRLITSKNPPYH